MSGWSMIPEDRFTNTVAGAAGYEAYRSRGSYGDADDYDRYDAARDAAHDAWEDQVRLFLDPLVKAELAALDELRQEIEETGYDPHPWNQLRHWLALQDEDEDALQEELEEYFREEAEQEAEENARENTPCCNDYHCPCH